MGTHIAAHWNIWQGNRDEDVRDGLLFAMRQGAKIIALNEAKFHHDLIGDIAKRKGFMHFQSPPQPNRGGVISEDGSNALLVHESYTLRGIEYDDMTEPWIFHKYDTRREPREQVRVTLRKNGETTRWSSSHFPTGGLTGGNSRAVRECLREQDAWLSRSEAPSADLGDMNMSGAALRAHYSDTNRKVYGIGVDHAVTARWKDAMQAVAANKFGSDHPLTVYTFIA